MPEGWDPDCHTHNMFAVCCAVRKRKKSVLLEGRKMNQSTKANNTQRFLITRNKCVSVCVVFSVSILFFYFFSFRACLLLFWSDLNGKRFNNKRRISALEMKGKMSFIVCVKMLSYGVCLLSTLPSTSFIIVFPIFYFFAFHLFFVSLLLHKKNVEQKVQNEAFGTSLSMLLSFHIQSNPKHWHFD